jgi:16S rRNA (cytosine1402-N4)-methyltransferase
MIFYKYGEEKFAPKIARTIVKYRQINKIETTLQLVEIIDKTIPRSFKEEKGHSSKKVFQSLRIFVNRELEVLENSLKQALEIVESEGRVLVISFHSLEDKSVKTIFNEAANPIIPRYIPIKDTNIKKEYRIVNKKVIIANEEEIKNNNRAHSAKLRIIEKI